LDTVLLEAGVVSEAGILQALADVSGVRLVNLADFEPNTSAAAHMPFGLTQQLNIVPLSLDGRALHLASAYPLSKSKLKNLGFVLGLKVELWVALECRIRAWQAVLYGQKLERRYQKLIETLDPAPQARVTAPGPEEEGRLSPDMLERIARGIVEEPLLLDRPKRASGGFEKDESSEPEGQATVAIETSTYERFARAGQGQSARETGQGSQHDQTVRVDLNGYSHFAREVSKTTLPHQPVVAPKRVTFPGGVLPPRRAAESAPDRQQRPSRPELVRPAPPPRPRVETLSPPSQPAPRRPTPKSLPPSLPEPKKVNDPDLDFSDVNEALKEPRQLSPHQASAPDRQARETLPPTVPTPPPTVTETQRPPGALPPPLPSLPVSSALDDEAREPSISGPPDTSRLQVRPADEPPVAPPVAHAFARPPDEAREGPIPPSALDWSLGDAKRSLALAKEDRDALVSVILEYGRRTFEFVGAFAVMKGAAVGWESRGGGTDPKALRQVSIPLDAASVFRTVALTRGSYIGPVPPDPLSQHYLALLGRAPRTVFLWPIEVKSRMVTMVYADHGAKPVSRRRLADYVLFCQELSTTFHELIVFRRNNARISQILPVPAEVELPQPPPAEQAPNPEWAANLIALLTGPDQAERSMAMTELAKHPELAAPTLGQAFPGPTGWSRRPVVEFPEPDELGPVAGALARMGKAGAEALTPLLASKDSGTRYLALLTAGSVRYPEVLDGVWAGLFDLEADVSSAARAAAVALRGVSGLEGRLPELRDALSSTDALKQSLAAKALGALHDRSSVELLIALTGSPDVLVAQSAATGLKDITRATFGADRPLWAQWWEEAQKHRRVEWLVDALDDGDRDTRQAAIEELSKAFGDPAGFSADAPEPERAEAVLRWRARVAEHPEIEV
jgi:HEAT repeat protein